MRQIVLDSLIFFCLIGTALAQGAITGLDFPGSAAVSTTMRFKFVAPHLHGLPIYGPNNQGVTYIWRAYPRQQASYYTTFFWGNDGNFYWDNGYAHSFYGAHPYPNPPPNGTAHNWEIAINAQDIVNGTVVYNQWYTQALRVWTSGGERHHTYYWDLPNTDSSHIVSFDIADTYGTQVPTSPALTWGDAPWNQGNEVYDGIIRGIRIYNIVLSESDMLSEASSPLSTTAGQNNVWYLNMNPTPSDITDKSGRGHNPIWVGSARPGLYTTGLLPPSAPVGLTVQ